MPGGLTLGFAMHLRYEVDTLTQSGTGTGEAAVPSFDMGSAFRTTATNSLH